MINFEDRIHLKILFYVELEQEIDIKSEIFYFRTQRSGPDTPKRIKGECVRQAAAQRTQKETCATCLLKIAAACGRWEINQKSWLKAIA